MRRRVAPVLLIGRVAREEGEKCAGFQRSGRIWLRFCKGWAEGAQGAGRITDSDGWPEVGAEANFGSGEPSSRAARSMMAMVLAGRNKKMFQVTTSLLMKPPFWGGDGGFCWGCGGASGIVVTGVLLRLIWRDDQAAIGEHLLGGQENQLADVVISHRQTEANAALISHSLPAVLSCHRG